MLSEGDGQQCRLSFGDPRRGRGESPYQFYAFYEFLCKYRQVEQKHVFDSLIPHYAALTSTSVLPLQCLSPASELHTRRWGVGSPSFAFHTCRTFWNVCTTRHLHREQLFVMSQGALPGW